MLTFERPVMEIQSIRQSIKQRFENIGELYVPEPGRLEMVVPRENIKALCRFMHDELGFEHITDLGAVDHRTKFEMVYQLCSYQNHCTAEVKVELPTDDASVDTVSDIWGGANWHEREAYDMFGIGFKGHPDLRRLLLPEDETIFPLRKSFKLKKDSTWNLDSKKDGEEGSE